MAKSCKTIEKMKHHCKSLLLACLTVAAVGCEPAYQVGDLYNQEGKTGIVFCVSDGGHHGKIVSLHETKAYWQTGRGIAAVGAQDNENGLANMQIIAQQPNWEQRYPAFAWCAEQGEGWYLPSIGEIEQIRKEHETVNESLRNAGGTPFFDPDQGVSHYYWSSTEGGDYVAYGCYIYDQRQTAPSRETKCYTQWVRAVAAF